jgi:ribosomal protein S4
MEIEINELNEEKDVKIKMKKIEQLQKKINKKKEDLKSYLEELENCKTIKSKKKIDSLIGQFEEAKDIETQIKIYKEINNNIIEIEQKLFK